MGGGVSRRCLRTLATVAVLVGLGGVPGAESQEFESAQVTTRDLGHGVHMLMGVGGNLGVSVGPDGVFLIDDQYAPMTEKIRASIVQLTDIPLRFVFNTHWHGDHTGGNENLGKQGALIVAHEGVRERMSTDQFIAAFDRKVPASPARALPVVTFSEEITFHINGHEVHAFHVAPAHTDGDSIVHFRTANVLHMGDVFFNRMYAFFDLSSGGSVDGMIAGLARGLELCDDDTKIIPGHGPLADRKDLEASLHMLRSVRDRVAAALAEGKSADEIVALAPSADFDDEFAGGFLKPEPFVRLVTASLQQR
jgi:cyclase